MENHQVVDEYAEIDLGLLSVPRFCAEIRAQTPLMSTKYAFDLSVHMAKEAAFHLPAVLCFWPAPGASSTFDGDQAVCLQFGSHELGLNCGQACFSGNGVA